MIPMAQFNLKAGWWLSFRMFENVLGQDGNFVQVHLVGGPGTNRSAIGARVSVTADGVTQTQEVEAGFGLSGKQDDGIRGKLFST